ncbi:MAG: nitroreductase family protein [Proteobacteria bacterium]|nr:nitroreductase family protein [Pseudomonadota bacterium]
MKSFLELAKARTSVRSYRPDPMPEEDLMRVLEAGRLAPSGNNAQPWRFIVVRDAGMKFRLCEVSGDQRWIVEAPVVIAVVADPEAKLAQKDRESFRSLDSAHRGTLLVKAVRDAAIAADHIVMAATDLGYGSCWVAMYEQEAIRPVLAVPDHCFVAALITLGRAAESPEPGSRIPLAELTFDERYGRRTEICRE